MKNVSYRFDPPLCIPPKGTAELRVADPAAADMHFLKRPQFIHVAVKDECKVTLADGLYEQDEKEPNLYRLKQGSAYQPNHLGGLS